MRLAAHIVEAVRMPYPVRSRRSDDGDKRGHERQTERYATMNANKLTRRTFLSTSAVTAGLLAAPSDKGQAAEPQAVTKAVLDRILDAPVLKTDFLKEPVIVASVELLL